ncbi:helix-turn-helix domain-containing protein [Pleurocapsa sp. FMAR1]|uniref:helix-turn-helix domain-containing protein n=1 Tax=Pleurocapsa sp. FMAR1 TaxID=3040204 RepID=UPI0029C94C5D|nr:helix-turn-helix domain-containing protein [Pleurocapsa sp. FMAR1]
MRSIKISTMKQPEVGELIRSLRHELELTQQQLSVELGTVTSTVNRWEMGHSQPSPMALKLIEAKLTELGERGAKLRSRFGEAHSRSR